MWHDQLLLTFLSTLCSFCSLSFHFFSFCLSSDKCRLVLPHPADNVHKQTSCPVEVWIPNHHQPPTSTNVPSSSDASVGFWNFSKELLVGLSTRFTRYCLSLNVSKCFQPRLQFWEYAAGLLSHVFSQPRAPNSRTNFSPFLQRAANDANPTWLSQRCPAWDVLAYQPRWQNDVKPWSSKPWRKSQNVMVRDVFLSATSLAY